MQATTEAKTKSLQDLRLTMDNAFAKLGVVGHIEETTMDGFRLVVVSPGGKTYDITVPEELYKEVCELAEFSQPGMPPKLETPLYNEKADLALKEAIEHPPLIATPANLNSDMFSAEEIVNAFKNSSQQVPLPMAHVVKEVTEQLDRQDSDYTIKVPPPYRFAINGVWYGTQHETLTAEELRVIPTPPISNCQSLYMISTGGVRVLPVCVTPFTSIDMTVYPKFISSVLPATELEAVVAHLVDAPSMETPVEKKPLQSHREKIQDQIAGIMRKGIEGSVGLPIRFDFSGALYLLKEGKAMRRAAWDSKMHARVHFADPGVSVLRAAIRPCFVAYYGDGTCRMNHQFSEADLLAEDWLIYNGGS